LVPSSAELGASMVIVAKEGPTVVTLVVTVAELFGVFGSGMVEVTLTVFVSVAADVGVTMMLMVAAGRGGVALTRVPRLQVIVVVPTHEPADGVAETRVTPPGNTSLTVTFVALTTGPLLTTEIT